MEAVLINKNLISELSLKKMMAAFFKGNTPDSAREFTFKLFQCWVMKDCNLKAELTNEEVALFFDQLIDLVAAAYNVYQLSVSTNDGKGDGHE